MKVRCIDDLGLTKLEIGEIYEGELKFSEWWEQDRWYIKGMENLCFKEHAFEIVKGDNMEKTFREVIADIKEGEVWECGHILITKSNDGIELKGMSSYSSYFTDDNKIFKLQRKQYTFEEAFKAYEEGKEIESCYSGVKYLIQHGGSDCYSDGRKTNLIEFNEIRGKWYINN